ncbi:hypothetical protein ABW21_db0200493 [Orbilia brochopaga]|nr:hypothetical protein ABW21_db0200493 [Drechslerella brochopaga]
MEGLSRRFYGAGGHVFRNSHTRSPRFESGRLLFTKVPTDSTCTEFATILLRIPSPPSFSFFNFSFHPLSSKLGFFFFSIEQPYLFFTHKPFARALNYKSRFCVVFFSVYFVFSSRYPFKSGKMHI